MTSLAPPSSDAHEKTIDLRLDRLIAATELAAHIHTQGADPGGFAPRTLVVLHENKALVATHAQTLTNKIVREHTPDDQWEQIHTHVRPLTLAVEGANIAIARLQVTLEKIGWSTASTAR